MFLSTRATSFAPDEGPQTSTCFLSRWCCPQDDDVADVRAGAQFPDRRHERRVLAFETKQPRADRAARERRHTTAMVPNPCDGRHDGRKVRRQPTESQNRAALRPGRTNLLGPQFAFFITAHRRRRALEQPSGLRGLRLGRSRTRRHPHQQNPSTFARHAHVERRQLHLAAMRTATSCASACPSAYVATSVVDASGMGKSLNVSIDDRGERAV